MSAVLTATTWVILTKDDTGDSQSTVKEYMDEKNLFNLLLIQNAIDNHMTEWDDIQNKIFKCYHNYIMCDLDPYSPPMEEVSPLDTDKDVADNAACSLSPHMRTLIIFQL